MRVKVHETDVLAEVAIVGRCIDVIRRFARLKRSDEATASAKGFKALGNLCLKQFPTFVARNACIDARP